MDLTFDYLEAILAKYYNLKCPKKVTKVESCPAVKKKENFASDARRIQLNVILQNGQSRKISVITKVAPESEARRVFIREVGLFAKEIKIYRDVLPVMESLLSSSFDHTTPPWPSMIHHEGTELIILTDLSPYGFKMSDRFKGLDFNHCSLVMGALAKFHALSVVMKDRGMLEVSDFDKYLLAADHPFIKSFFRIALTHTAEIVSLWGEEWQGIAKDLLNIEYILSKIKEMACTKVNDFNVLIHGDAWTNNILFKYCPYTDKVIEVRLIDFQLAHYGSYALDIIYFLYTSADSQLRLGNDELLEIYHKTLTKTFQLHGHHPKNLPTREGIKREIEEKKFYGVILAVTFLHHAHLDKASSFDLAEQTAIDEKTNEIFKSDHYVNAAKNILRPYIGTQFFKSNLEE